MAAAQDEGEGKLEQQQGAATGCHGPQACQRIRVATLATGPMRAIGGVQENGSLPAGLHPAAAFPPPAAATAPGRRCRPRSTHRSRDGRRGGAPCAPWNTPASDARRAGWSSHACASAPAPPWNATARWTLPAATSTTMPRYSALRPGSARPPVAARCLARQGNCVIREHHSSRWQSNRPKNEAPPEFGGKRHRGDRSARAPSQETCLAPLYRGMTGPEIGLLLNHRRRARRPSVCVQCSRNTNKASGACPSTRSAIRARNRACSRWAAGAGSPSKAKNSGGSTPSRNTACTRR